MSIIYNDGFGAFVVGNSILDTCWLLTRIVVFYSSASVCYSSASVWVRRWSLWAALRALQGSRRFMDGGLLCCLSIYEISNNYDNTIRGDELGGSLFPCNILIWWVVHGVLWAWEKLIPFWWYKAFFISTMSHQCDISFGLCWVL